ncbi:MAG: purine phosphorylase [Sphingomonadaceae bacterium]
MRIGIITGMAEEAAAFMAQTPGALVSSHGFSGRTLICGGHEVTIIHAGIGKVNAATAASLLALHYQAELLMIIGTAGKLSATPGDCFLVTEAVQGDYGASHDSGFVHFTAGSVPIGASAVVPFVAAAMPDTGLPRARIVSGDCFVASGTHAARLRGELGGDLVDMETAALAQMAARLGLPWAAIKATTDDANGESSGDFRANLARAAAKAAGAAEAMIGLLPEESSHPV